jgi:uncharacterized protein (DUF1684 family)
VPLDHLALALALLAPAAAAVAAGPAPDPAFAAGWKAWHERRLASLQRPQGWLALAGLHWLEPGENRVAGLPGVFVLDGTAVTLRAAAADGYLLDGAPVAERALRSDQAERQDRLALGGRTVAVIVRGDRVALRVWDAARPERVRFSGIDAFPVDPRWRIRARWEPYARPREVEIPAAAGPPQQGLAPGRAVFELDGRTLSLQPTQDGDELFFVFKDRTAPRETYGGGRFLVAEPPSDGVVVLDFNRAYNPPCVFSPYATCPLPIPENVLPVRVEAGEKAWRGAGR